jgi:hypothetical protein
VQPWLLHRLLRGTEGCGLVRRRPRRRPSSGRPRDPVVIACWPVDRARYGHGGRFHPRSSTGSSDPRAWQAKSGRHEQLHRGMAFPCLTPMVRAAWLPPNAAA